MPWKTAEHRLDHFEAADQEFEWAAGRSQGAAKAKAKAKNCGPAWPRPLQLIAGAPRRSATQRLLTLVSGGRIRPHCHQAGIDLHGCRWRGRPLSSALLTIGLSQRNAAKQSAA